MSKIYEALQLEQRRREEENIQPGPAVEKTSPILEPPPSLFEKTIPKLEKTYPLFVDNALEHSGVRDRSIEQEMIGLYYALESQLQESESRVIQFIGSQEGEGTSLVAHEFARVVSVELRKSILLFDADSHKSPVKREPSLEQLINNESRLDELTQPQTDRSFLVCPVSSNGTSPASILNSTLVAPFFKQLKTHFDLVLIDSPPLSHSAHGLAICRKTDGVVMVLEAGNTKWPLAVSNKEKIEKAGGRVLGVVLNKSRSHVPAAIQRFL